jgi:hypothetical protein
MTLGMKIVTWGAMCFLASCPAWACGDGKVLFQDTFQTLNPTWTFTADTARSNGADGLSYVLKPGAGNAKLNNASLYDDYEVCATFEDEETSGDSAGFSAWVWGVDTDNGYGVSVAPGPGTYQVFRVQRNKYLAQTPWTEDPAIVKGDKAANETSVAVKGTHAVVSINGKKIYEFDGSPPDNGSLAGFDVFATKTNKADAKITIKKFEVREIK